MKTTFVIVNTAATKSEAAKESPSPLRVVFRIFFVPMNVATKL